MTTALPSSCYSRSTAPYSCSYGSKSSTSTMFDTNHGNCLFCLIFMLLSLIPPLISVDLQSYSCGFMIESLRFDLHGTHVAFNHSNSLINVVITEVGDLSSSLICQQLGFFNFILLGYDSGRFLYLARILLFRIHPFSKII
jgi:hypothetical protein